MQRADRSAHAADLNFAARISGATVLVRPANDLVVPLPDGIAGDPAVVRTLWNQSKALGRERPSWQFVELTCTRAAYHAAHPQARRDDYGRTTPFPITWLLDRIQGMCGGKVRLSYDDPRTETYTIRLLPPSLQRSLIRALCPAPAFDWDYAAGDVAAENVLAAHARDHQPLGLADTDLHFGDIGAIVPPTLYRVHDYYHAAGFFAFVAIDRAITTTLLATLRALPLFQELSAASRTNLDRIFLEPEWYPRGQPTLEWHVQRILDFISAGAANISGMSRAEMREQSVLGQIPRKLRRCLAPITALDAVRAAEVAWQLDRGAERISDLEAMADF